MIEQDFPQDYPQRMKITSSKILNNFTTRPTMVLLTNPNGDDQVIQHMTPVFVCIAIMALFGNLLVVFLFIQNRGWLKKVHSILILMLAITDILTAICILCVPLFIHESDVYTVPESEFLRELYCRVVWSQYLVFSLGVTSVYLCLSLAIERWLAIKKPLFYRQNINSKRAVLSLVVIPWLAGFIFESTAIVWTTGVVLPNGTTSCRWNSGMSERATRVTIAIFSFCGMMLIPGILVVLAYVQILVKIKGILKPPSVQSQNSQQRSKRLNFKRVTLMSALASLTLLLCWLPSQFYFMLFQMGYFKIYITAHRWVTVLALSSSCWNPIIYCFSNPQYREGFKTELSSFLCLCKLVKKNPNSLRRGSVQGEQHCTTHVTEGRADEISLEPVFTQASMVENEKEQNSDNTAL